MKKNCTGAEAFCQALKLSNIELVVGIPGTQDHFLFSELAMEGIRTIVPANEQGGSFIVNGYARVSGKPAVLLVVSGPGFTHALSGVAEAWSDSVPMVFVIIGPEARSGMVGQLHCLNHKEIASSLVKEYFEVKEANSIPEIIIKSYKLSLSGEPGPVAVYISDRVLQEQGKAVDRNLLQKTEQPQLAQQLAEQLKGLVELINKSRRVALFCGAGCFNCSEELEELAEKLSAPVITTVTARGLLPETHPLSMYEDTSFAAPEALNLVFGRADLVIALGVKFSHNSTGGFRIKVASEKLVHIDSERNNLGVNYPALMTYCLSPESVIRWLNNQISAERMGWDRDELENLRVAVQSEQVDAIPLLPRVADGEPQDFFAALSRVISGVGFVVTDTGMHQFLARTFIQVSRPRELMVPTDFQALGYGISAGIGVAVANSQCPVVALVGDGAFLASCNEIATAVRERINLTIIVFNDGHYGLIRLQQITACGKEANVDLPSFNIAELAMAFGCKYFRLDYCQEENLKGMIEAEGVKIVEVVVKDSKDAQKNARVGKARAYLKRILGESFWNSMKAILR